MPVQGTLKIHELALCSRCPEPASARWLAWLGLRTGSVYFGRPGSFVTFTHCCWEPKNTFINGKTRMAPQRNILTSTEERAGGLARILRKRGLLISHGEAVSWGAQVAPAGWLPAAAPAHPARSSSPALANEGARLVSCAPALPGGLPSSLATRAPQFPVRLRAVERAPLQPLEPRAPVLSTAVVLTHSLPAVALRLCPVAFIPILQIQKLRQRGEAGHKAREKQSWDLNPDQLP